MRLILILFLMGIWMPADVQAQFHINIPENFTKSVLMSDSISSNLNQLKLIRKEDQRTLLKAGLAGGFAFSIMGAMIGSDIQTCNGKSCRSHSVEGFFGGAAIGTIVGFAFHRKKLKKSYGMLRVMAGATAGGLLSHYLWKQKDIFLLSTWLVVPIAASIPLHF